jgi:uncharacterized protein YeaO (DUF488 family)
MHRMAVRVGRVYDRTPAHGTRVLVDRLWPRGVRRDDERIDEWLAEGYAAELDDEAHREALAALRALTKARTVTLVTATKDVDHSQAAVLARVLDDRPG